MDFVELQFRKVGKQSINNLTPFYDRPFDQQQQERHSGIVLNISMLWNTRKMWHSCYFSSEATMQNATFGDKNSLLLTIAHWSVSSRYLFVMTSSYFFSSSSSSTSPTKTITEFAMQAEDLSHHPPSGLFQKSTGSRSNFSAAQLTRYLLTSQ